MNSAPASARTTRKRWPKSGCTPASSNATNAPANANDFRNQPTPSNTINEPTKVTREQRHTGKRLAAINALLDGHLKTTPLPATPPILHIVAAFGLDVAAGECAGQAQHERAWASLDAKDRVADFNRDFWAPRNATPKTYTREEVLWQHVTPLLRHRLAFRVNRDLLPGWKQQDMERIAALTGFDYAGQWKTLCAETLPVPKSWGAGIDPMTLQPTTLGAGWRRVKSGIVKPCPTTSRR